LINFNDLRIYPKAAARPRAARIRRLKHLAFDLNKPGQVRLAAPRLFN
jgi:hypothetical protein